MQTCGKRLAGRLASDSDMKENCTADRLEDVVNKSVKEVVAEISKSLHGRMTKLEAKARSGWETFEKK